MNWLKKIGVGGRGAGTAPQVPPGLRVYAVGDIHGRVDLLEKLGGQIRQHLKDEPAGQSLEIYLGDYVDRGPDSRAVLDYLSDEKPNCDRRYCLKGNHEAILLEFLNDPLTLDYWRDLGGRETLFSYGVQPPQSRDPDLAVRCRDEFEHALPEKHMAFLRSLPFHIEVGSYLFVHAGIRPGKPIAEQDEDDFLWIRDPFLNSKRDHGRIVVHGHTPQSAYEILPNRINVDTWAFLSGCLTCVILEGENQQFMQATV